jgi:prefoldin subunit 5
MTDFVTNMGLHMEGFTDEQIAQINEAIPYAQALVTRINANMALLNTLMADIQKIMPTVQMALTVVHQKGQA